MIKKILQSSKLIKSGDWFVIISFCTLILISAKILWDLPQGQYLEIYKNNKILATYSLNQKFTKKLHGIKGETEIIIDNGRRLILFSNAASATKGLRVEPGG